ANFSERNNVWLRGIRVAGGKAGGVGFFCGGGGTHSLRGWQTKAGPVADWEGRRFSMETLLIALQSYGDLFVGLKEDDKVAWLSTWTEETTGAWTWGRPWQFYHAAEAFYSLMRAHFPANIIEEREVLEDRLTLDKAKVLLISTRKVALPEEIIDKIKGFMKKGGKVLVTKCAPAVNIPGAIKVNLDMTQGMQVHNMPGWDGEGEYLKPEKRFKEYKDELRNKLYSAVTPFVDAESMWITMSVQKYGKAKYVFAVSDLYPPLYNSARKGHRYGSLSSDGYFSIPWRMKYTMPAEHRLYFNKSDGELPEGFVVYDMFNQKLLKLNDPEPSAKGWKAGKRTLDIHFVNNPARILVCLPKPIEKLSLALSPSVKPGELLRTKIRVLASDGQPIDALFPVEVKITDPDGKLRYHVWRTGGPDKERMYKIATNDTPGKWTFWARELVSGCISENTFVVESDAADNLRIRRIDDKTIVFDEYNVWDLLRNNQVEGPIYIVLGKPQKRLEPLARKLKAALESIGTKAQVKYYARSEARAAGTEGFAGE
ncbi:MAG: hypothetical protein QGD94_08185, partial [Planctomycetia bacterium]|nr:hypothetical protein [Planctomycetia bacterium]